MGQLGHNRFKLTSQELAKARIIAGKGSPVAIDKIKTLTTIFGGKESDWVKTSTTNRSPNIHWYEGPNGIKVGMKEAGDPDPF